MTNRTQNGFTLYELLITMVVIGIVLAVGVPGFGEFTQNSRMTGTVNELHSSFLLARSEAARSKSNVTICASTNSQAANADCAGEFEDGWIIFVDTDGDIERDAGEALLRAHGPTPPGIDIATPAQADYFSYTPTGLGRGNVTGVAPVQTAVLCDKRGNVVATGGASAARVLVVTPIGRATVLRDETQVANAGGCPENQD